MQYLIIAKDHTINGLKRRLAVRQEHIALGNKMRDAGQALFGAATLDEEGNMNGSVMVVEFESRVNVDQPPIADMALALTAQNKVSESLDRGDFVQACADQKESNKILSMLKAMPDLIRQGQIMERLICAVSKQKQQGEVT